MCNNPLTWQELVSRMLGPMDSPLSMFLHGMGMACVAFSIICFIIWPGILTTAILFEAFKIHILKPTFKILKGASKKPQSKSGGK